MRAEQVRRDWLGSELFAVTFRRNSVPGLSLGLFRHLNRVECVNFSAPFSCPLPPQLRGWEAESVD